MVKSKLIKFTPTEDVRGIFKDMTISKSDKEIVVSAHPSDIAKLLLAKITVKEVSHDGSMENEITWDNLWTDSTMPAAPEKVSYENSAFTSILTDYIYPEFKLSARFSNVDSSKTVVRKITIAGQDAGTKMIVNGEEVELEAGGTYTYTHTKDYAKTNILECRLLKLLTVGESLSVTQSSTSNGVKVGEDNTITASVKGCTVDFNGTTITEKDDHLLCNLKYNASNIYGMMGINAKVTVDNTPIEGVKFDTMFDNTSVTDKEGKVFIKDVNIQGPSILTSEIFVTVPKGKSGSLKIEFSCEMYNGTRTIALSNNIINHTLKAASATVDVTGKECDTIGSFGQLIIKSAFTNMPIGMVNRKLVVKRDGKVATDVKLTHCSGVELQYEDGFILPQVHMYTKERELSEEFRVLFNKQGKYTFECESVIYTFECESVILGIKFTSTAASSINVKTPDVDLTGLNATPDAGLINQDINVDVVTKVVNVLGHMVETVAVTLDDAPFEGSVSVNGKDVEVDEQGKIMLFNSNAITEYITQLGKTDRLVLVPTKAGSYKFEVAAKVINSSQIINKTNSVTVVVTEPVTLPIREKSRAVKEEQVVEEQTAEDHVEEQISTMSLCEEIIEDVQPLQLEETEAEVSEEPTTETVEVKEVQKFDNSNKKKGKSKK